MPSSPNPDPVADRLALRELVERYALAVDRRQPATVAALFAEDGVLVVPRPPRSLGPTVERSGRDAVQQAIAAMGPAMTTLHAVVGHVVDLDGDTATGVVSCLAHHVQGEPGSERDLVWAMHYDDEYRRQDDGWRFQQRLLTVEWIEDRPVAAVRAPGAEDGPPSERG